MEKKLTTNATPDNALLPARKGAVGLCHYDNDVPDINLQDKHVEYLFREIGLGREFRLNEKLKMIYCALYHVINDYDTRFKKENIMHWCLLIPLLISLGCTKNSGDKATLKYYFDLFHYWFPHKFEECNIFKNGGMEEMKKQLRNGGRDEKIVKYKDLPPSKWADKENKKIYRYIDGFTEVLSRFEEYLKEYKQIKI